jgi:Rieske Fe-S protein
MDPESNEPLPQENLKEDPARRHFLKGLIGITAGMALLLAGTIDKIFLFFFGPRLTRQQETEVMQQRLERLKSTVGVRQLELEREESAYILVAPLSELDKTTGKYFIDYQMRPALAFLGKDGLPELLSAKCTHLGCTVGNQVDAHGKILCPCHVSYFDVTTGQPDPNAPAKAPLPHLGWVIKDKGGKVLASRLPSGVTTGDTKAVAVDGASVYIVKTES